VVVEKLEEDARNLRKEAKAANEGAKVAGDALLLLLYSRYSS